MIAQDEDYQTLGSNIAALEHCSPPVVECDAFLFLQEGLQNEHSLVYQQQIKGTLEKSSNDRINLLLIQLLLQNLDKDQAIVLFSDLISTLHNNSEKINSFFYISLVIFILLGLYLIYLGYQMSQLKKSKANEML